MDGGSTWSPQQTGVTTPLTAGVSPIPSVCWFVGTNGVIVITTDGRTWRRISFPEAVDLVAIQATDASTATVTTSDGGNSRPRTVASPGTRLVARGWWLAAGKCKKF
jgi:photosystem II stability/assembly factor-like uncharacterized protein